jgi:hypothetical protein
MSFLTVSGEAATRLSPASLSLAIKTVLLIYAPQFCYGSSNNNYTAIPQAVSNIMLET